MSIDALFDASATFVGDALRPDLENVCPADLVARLTRPQREQRVERLIEQAHQIVDTAWGLADGRMRAAWCILFSGGNDSTVLAHLMKDRVDYAVHANTTVGVEETRQFVRDTCAKWNLELIERKAPHSYRDLVLGRVKGYKGGFPGPAMHYLMFQRLKMRQLESIRTELVTNPRRERVLFIAGRRRSESKRRVNVPLHETKGSIIWASPLAMWTKLDMNTYRLMMGDVPVNQVSDMLHMSGECLCGAFAKPNELEEIRLWYPDMAAEIDELQADVRAAGFTEPHCNWGHGRGVPSPRVGELCSSCQLNIFEDEEIQA